MRESPLSPLGEHLVEQVLSKFPEQSPTVCDRGATAIVIPALLPNFGDIEIDDDEDEITIYFGRFTHVHFGCCVDGLTGEQKQRKIVEDVCSYLTDVFSDRIEFFTRIWGGGCGPRGRTGGEVFVWSGQLYTSPHPSIDHDIP